MSASNTDPKGLIREAYRIEGITAGECRSIFLDWAISVPVDQEAAPLIRALIAQYEPEHADHPMTAVLKEGLGTPPVRKRRGGRSGRVPDS